MSIPKIKMKGISQSGFADAFAVLEECRIDQAPVKGFIYPFFAPGGMYGANWWNIDSSIALAGYRWKDRAFAENGVRNFLAAQKPDGRIPLYGDDVDSRYAEEVSSLPKLFGVAYSLAAESENMAFVRECYMLITRYIEWWLSRRRDRETGLLSAVFEETFVPYLGKIGKFGKSGEYAPVDTNVELVLGLGYAAALAERLGESADKARYETLKSEFVQSINRWLWNEEKGAYYPYLLAEKRHEDFLMASTFLPLRAGIAAKDRAEKLVKLLLSDRFGWNTYPVFSAAKDDKRFTVTEGDYQFNASWSGSVWSLLNAGIVQGLKDSGYEDLAATLAYRTVKEFHENYAEFLQPFNGSGHGVKRYAWTAAHYIGLILESIFGIKIDAEKKSASARPLLCGELKNETLSAENIVLPDGGRLCVYVENGKTRLQIENSGYRAI